MEVGGALQPVAELSDGTWCALLKPHLLLLSQMLSVIAQKAENKQHTNEA